MKKIIISLILFLGYANGYAQKQWTLKDLFAYARENNLKIKQSQIKLQQAEIDHNTAKNAILPNLYAGAKQNFINAPFSIENRIISTGTGAYVESSSVNKNTFTSNFQIGSSVNLYNAGKYQNRIKQSELSIEATRLSVQAQEHDIFQKIIQLYVQNLHTNEAIKIYEEILNASKKQVDRAFEMHKQGVLSKSELSQFIAQKSSDEYDLVNAQTTQLDYQTQLKQLLQIKDDVIPLKDTAIDTIFILSPLENKEFIYAKAMDNRPEIKINTLNSQISALNIKLAKADYYPVVNLQGIIGGYYQNEGNSFFKQIKNSWNNALELAITIPIFNRKSTQNNILKSIKDYENNLIFEDITALELKQAIEKTWVEAYNAQQKFLFAQDKRKSFKESYALMREKYYLGLANISELMMERSNYMRAELEVLQSKYTSLFNRILLNFYAGEEVNI